MKQNNTLNRLPPKKSPDLTQYSQLYSKSLEKNKKSFASSERSNFIHERSEKGQEISTSRINYKHRSTSSLFSDWDFSFHPEINSNSRKISGERPKENIHEKLYLQGKAMKRCKSFKISPVSNNFRQFAIDYDRIYKSSLLYKAESRGKNLFLRRNQSISEAKELKFSPTTCKFNFAVPRKPKKIENLLMLTEVHKRASRYKLVRKFQNK